MLRNGANIFEVNFYCKNFRSEPRNSLSILSKFRSLQILKIVEEPDLEKPVFVKSIVIQQILEATPELKELTLECMNGFDHFCLQKILKSQLSCALKLQSYRNVALEIAEVNRIEKQSSINSLPFRLSG